MQAERWLTVKQLFEGALVLSPHDREAFLAEGCKNDLLLRREVESLIESYVHAGAFLEGSPTPPFGGASVGLAGRRIGPYDIGDCIGAGGMGQVYRAQDTRLARTVAIKVCADRMRGRLDLREQRLTNAAALGCQSTLMPSLLMTGAQVALSRWI